MQMLSSLWKVRKEDSKERVACFGDSIGGTVPFEGMYLPCAAKMSCGDDIARTPGCKICPMIEYGRHLANSCPFQGHVEPD